MTLIRIGENDKAVLTGLEKQLRIYNLLNRPVLSTEDFAELLYTNPDKVDTLRRAGCIKAQRRGRGYNFTRKAVDDFLKEYADADISNVSTITAEKEKRRPR
ncbi:MAG: helix-turn-helix domain-containing protein [Lachnospiraceae bacterium]|nr:helix-turn-helix domain-containing protein [Lachnospiraceae bacterium]